MAEIGVEIIAQDKTATAVAAARKSLSGLQGVAKGALNVLKVGATGGALALAGVGTAALNVSKETATASKAMQADLGLTEKAAGELAGVAQDVFANNFAGSVGEAADAVIDLRKHVGDLNTIGDQAATEAAFNIADAFDQPVEDIIAAVGVLQNEFDGLSTEKAFDLITAGFQQGLDKSGDLLDSIGEYSNLFASGGATAGEFFQTMKDGMEGGVLGTDKIADAFKEFQIKLLEGDKEFGKSLTRLGVDQEALFTGINDGSITTQDAMRMIVDELNEIESPMRRAQEEAALFGTMAEDLGSGFTKNLSLVAGGFDDVAGKTDALNVQYETVEDMLSGVWRTVLVALTPFTDQLVKMANVYLPKVQTWVSENMPKIISFFTDAYEKSQPFISGFATGASTIFSWLQDFWGWLSANEPLMIATFVAIGAAMVVAMGPASLAVAAITGIVTAVGLIKENWDTIEGYFAGLWEGVGKTFSDTWGLIRDFVLTPFMQSASAVTDVWSGISQWFVDLWNNIGQGFADAWQGITDILFPNPSYGEQIITAWANIVDGIQEIFRNGANAAIRVLNKLVDAMRTPLKSWNELSFGVEGFSKTFQIPKLLGGGERTIGWGGITLETPNVPLPPRIPALAAGGVVTQPTFALIGEAGPEAVIPLNDAGGGRLMRPINVTVNIGGSLVTEHQAKTEVVRTINEAIRHGALA